ncbi:MAG: 6,7-dimethyl-8-ribityllumazine synthase [Gammaproteobacteria bacterium]|nr:6,7-dimethyl-8-ribityllumazine synthase [Gammaproteobacteria bacterium]
MNTPRIIEGDSRVGDLRIALVASRFNAPVVERLVAGAVEALAELGADPASLELVRVPGAFDLPPVVRRLAESRRCDAIVALGAVIRGDTPHFDYVAGECAAGLARIASETGVPVAFGVLTTDTEEQALERAGGSEGNRGADAARVAVELANLMRRLAK